MCGGDFDDKHRGQKKISTFLTKVRVCTKAQLCHKNVGFNLFSLMGVDVEYFAVRHTVFSNLLPSAE